jgi:hypothetical protein
MTNFLETLSKKIAGGASRKRCPVFLFYSGVDEEFLDGVFKVIVAR